MFNELDPSGIQFDTTWRGHLVNINTLSTHGARTFIAVSKAKSFIDKSNFISPVVTVV